MMDALQMPKFFIYDESVFRNMKKEHGEIKLELEKE